MLPPTLYFIENQSGTRVPVSPLLADLLGQMQEAQLEHELLLELASVHLPGATPPQIATIVRFCCEPAGEADYTTAREVFMEIDVAPSGDAGCLVRGLDQHAETPLKFSSTANLWHLRPDLVVERRLGLTRPVSFLCLEAAVSFILALDPAERARKRKQAEEETS